MTNSNNLLNLISNKFFKELLNTTEDKLFFPYLNTTGKALVTAILFKSFKSNFFVFTSYKEAENLHNNLKTFNLNSIYLPTATDYFAQKKFYKIYEQIKDKANPLLLVFTPEVITSGFIKKENLKAITIKDGNIFFENEQIFYNEFLHNLVYFGFSRSESILQECEFSVYGSIINIFLAGEKYPCRLQFKDEVVEKIYFYNQQTQQSLKEIKSLSIIPLNLQTSEHLCFSDFLKKLNTTYKIITTEEALLDLESEIEYAGEEQAKYLKEEKKFLKENTQLKFSLFKEPKINFFNLTASSLENFQGNLFKFLRTLKIWQKQNYQVFIVSKKIKELKKFFLEQELKNFKEINDWQNNFSIFNLQSSIVNLFSGFLSAGIVFPHKSLIIISDKELGLTEEKDNLSEKKSLSKKIDFSPGDFLVHKKYGIGKFMGMRKITTLGKTQEYFYLKYKDRAELFVPIYSGDNLHLYISADGKPPSLSKLGTSFENVKKKVQENLLQIARQLYIHYKLREKEKGFIFAKDTAWQKDLEESFFYEDTLDQIKVLKEIKKDMEEIKPMDRLLCGDVGYGKTEIAVRTAFKAVMSGKQVAVLAPTTVLAQQHYDVFSERLKKFPVTIELLSRFVSKKKQIQIINDLKKGVVDIIIGTHRLLSKDVAFKNLGFLILDEEQRFGVLQKEKIQQLQRNIDVLMLSATPIPRTLSLALQGIKDISVIETPPPGRLPIETYLCEYDKKIIKEAILNEYNRGGQVFFVHNKVFELPHKFKELKNLLPNIKIAVAHGQMSGQQLEKIMKDFYQQKYTVLLCSTIIENGLDLPKANTIIVSNAHNLGLAQAYQLRGRVGRTNIQAFAYFLFPARHLLSAKARERLQALLEFAELGSGMLLAKKDLEIRGAGQFLGKEQSGFVKSVGMELYQQIFEEAFAQIKGKYQQQKETEIILPVEAFIPEDFIYNPKERIKFYKLLSFAESVKEIEEVKNSLEKNYFFIPQPVENLILIAKIREVAKNKNINKIFLSNDKIIIVLQDKQEILLDKIKSIDKKILNLLLQKIEKFIANTNIN